MLTPYDWQEGIGNRAQYIEAKLAQGTPVLAVSLDEGIVLFAYRRQARKIYEVYDRLAFSAIGQQSDVEALRTAAVDFAHQEGYNRSEQDVTIQRVVTALSTPLKKAFADFSASPIVARSIFVEVGETPAEDLFYTLDYDGDYMVLKERAAIAGDAETEASLVEKISAIGSSLTPEAAVEALQAAWDAAWPEGQDRPEEIRPEAVLLERTQTRENRFRHLVGAE